MKTTLLFILLMTSLYAYGDKDCNCKGVCTEVKNPIETMKIRAVI